MTTVAPCFDHVFVMTPPGALECRRHLASLGLVESYERIHPGQGTRNVCYAFHNAFLELLWVHDSNEAQSASIARTGLWERVRWRDTGACPFGISWRGELEIPTWAYRPPYMGDGAIAVADVASPLHSPLLFRSPGTAPPGAVGCRPSRATAVVI